MILVKHAIMSRLIRKRTDESIAVCKERARQSLRPVRAGMAAGPDGMPAKALK